MSIPYPWLLEFGITALFVVPGATSGLMNAGLWLSEPLVFAASGAAIRPFGPNLLYLDPAADNQAHAFLREAAQVTLAIAVLVAALRLPPGWLGTRWRGPAVALGCGMLMMWAVGARDILDVRPASVRLAAGRRHHRAAVPVLSAPVVSGELARPSVSSDLWNAITAKSSINDGRAGPFVTLPFVLLAVTGGIGPEVDDWLLHAVLWEVRSAVVVGWLCR